MIWYLLTLVETNYTLTLQPRSRTPSVTEQFTRSAEYKLDYGVHGTNLKDGWPPL
jgi:hypothetical protein